MNTFFVIFIGLLSGGIASVSSAQQVTFDVAPNEQTKRVVGDEVLKGMLKPLIKKYKVNCKIPVSDGGENKNPHWTCLNNNACSYAVKVICSEKKGAHKNILEVEVDGFDDGKTSKVQDVSVTYSQP